MSHRAAGISPEADPISRAFQAVVPQMLTSAAAKGGGTSPGTLHSAVMGASVFVRCISQVCQGLHLTSASGTVPFVLELDTIMEYEGYTAGTCLQAKPQKYPRLSQRDLRRVPRVAVQGPNQQGGPLRDYAQQPPGQLLPAQLHPFRNCTSRAHFYGSRTY